MDRFLIDMLECPLCHQPLDWQIDHQFENQIEQAEARCSGCEATFPVREGIGIFLTPELPRNDLWEQVDSQLTSYLRDHPDIERTLMESAARRTVSDRSALQGNAAGGTRIFR